MWGGEAGEAAGKDDWGIVLGYEHEVRREMVNKMLEGTPLEKALRDSWTDPVVRDRYLVTPLQRRSITGKRVAPQAPAGSGSASKKKRKTGGGGEVRQPEVRQSSSSQGKGKGKVRAFNGCASTTPDGRRICFAYNNEGCQRPSCSFLHVCGVCFKKGEPMNRCKHDVLQ